LVVLIDAKNKFIAAPEDISDEGIEAFVTRVQNGEVTKLLKSAPIPENDNEAVKTLVGKNYRDVVFGDDKEFLVKFYAPWCGHCKTIAPEFVAAAEAIASNPNIVLAELDGTLNEVEGVDISGFPTIFWYPKDKTQEPIQYNGGRDKEGIISWLKDHTQHPWVEESEAEPEETVEAEL
jgi:protein disulfide isomerase